MYFYDRFANEFDEAMNMYDTNKRMVIVFDEMLGSRNLESKKLLDAGSGTGWFSKAARERGADVFSLDIGLNILGLVAQKCDSERIVGSVLQLPFADNTFDYVVNTEVIEHTPVPMQVIPELHRVLRPAGVLVLTVPNRIWRFSVVIANALKLRPYEGFENWVHWGQLRRRFEECGFKIEVMKGFHIVPFVSPRLYNLIDCFDRFGAWLGPIMLNIAVKARK
jgi:2-polyprenyl-6-hydroxyphenyl methylase/3-demethylubiquinone-9 3-methyltransferase